MGPLISILLPVYNLERYLPTALINLTTEQFSPEEQDLWELIVIDDGSTDNSASIISSFAKRYYPNNVRLIQTGNRGVSSARNLALENASGRYVYFTDGDDLLKRNALSSLCKHLQEQNSDVVHFGYEPVTSERYDKLCKDIPRAEISGLHTIDNRRYSEETIGFTQPQSQWAVWQNIFRREFLTYHQLKFNPGLRIGEDAVFFWSVMLNNPVVRITDTPLYLYQHRADSAFHSPLSQQMISTRIDYIGAMTDICDRLRLADYGRQTLFGIRCNLRYTARQIITTGLICGPATFREIYVTLLRLRRHGICGTGLTRPMQAHSSMSPRQQWRRLLTAYVIIPIIKLIY